MNDTQTERQDFVDNTIEHTMRTLVPSRYDYRDNYHDIEYIGEVRDKIQECLKAMLAISPENSDDFDQQFYPSKPHDTATELGTRLSYVRKNYIETGSNPRVIFDVIVELLTKTLNDPNIKTLANQELVSIFCPVCSVDVWVQADLKCNVCENVVDPSDDDTCPLCLTSNGSHTYDCTF